jgi:hypothetical protein
VQSVKFKVTGRSEIFLVGVVHGDPDGYDKLLRLLQRLRPRIISVEISEYSWRCRRRQEARWQRQFQRGLRSLPPEQRKHVALLKVAAQIDCPFEVRAAEDYGRRWGVAWQAVDINSLAREHLPRYAGELLSPDNLRNLVLTPDADWGEYIRQEYRRARRALQAGQIGVDGLAARAGFPAAAMREKVLAHRVRRLARKWPRVVHLGGWEHLITSGPNKTMADFLTAWRPQRLLLDGKG